MQNQVEGPASFLTADSLDEPVDPIIATHELTRRMCRDETKAEYRAGLVAGGQELDGDWLEWFANQIRLWPNDDANINALAGINRPGFREQMESLPPSKQRPNLLAFRRKPELLAMVANETHRIPQSANRYSAPIPCRAMFVGSGHQRQPSPAAHGQPESPWRSSSSSPHQPGGEPSTPYTWSPSDCSRRS